MTNHIVDANKMVPPPHLLKKFSEQARMDSKKRGHSGYCKTFAKLCIDWAFQQLAMDEYRAASAEVGIFQSTPNDRQIRSSEIEPPFELVQQWFSVWEASDQEEVSFAKFAVPRAAQWGADQELEACCEWVDRKWSGVKNRELRTTRRPKPPSLNEVALQMLGTIERDAHYIPEITDTIRRALEARS